MNITIQGFHICLLTSSRLSSFTYGGEGKFTISLGKWLMSYHQIVTMIGSGFRKTGTKSSSEETGTQLTNPNSNASQTNLKKVSIPYFIFLIYRLTTVILWIVRIMILNLRSPIAVIHAQDTGYAGLAAVLCNKLLGIPAVISTHGIRHKTQESNIHGRLKRILLKIEFTVDIFSIKNSNKVIADNHSIKRYFEKIIPRAIDVIPIPIKLKNFEFSEHNRNTIRKELRIDETTKVIGFVGRLSAEKNLFTLIISFSRTSLNTRSKKLVLVGTGPLESHLRRFASKMGIEDMVIFCGVRSDIGRLLSGFDIFVLPSYTEGVSTALLEAMASGRAIICSDISSNRELVRHNQEALLFDPYSQEELKKAMELLLNNESLQLDLGRKARIIVGQYDEEMVFPKYLQYYENLLKEGKGNKK